MIRVTIELESAITGKTRILGRMMVWNKGETSDPMRGDYGVSVCKKGTENNIPFGTIPTSVTRTGEVLNYPRLSYNVWRLIARALKSAFPEEA